MRNSRKTLAFVIAVTLAGFWAAPLLAQAPLPVPGPPPGVPQGAPLPGAGAPLPAAYPPAELDRIVSPIALYPDPLLAQVLTAATFYNDIPDAAGWADQHHYLTGPALASAMATDQVPWDPSVQALVAFPSVLDMMASAMPWTQEIGSAFLAQPNDVMDAVQRMRHSAVQYGYLRSGPQVIVSNGPYIEIQPVSPGYIVVPYYDPLVVYAPPRRGFFVGGAVRFGFGVTLGAVWAPWGWGASRFAWNTHTVIINNNPWRRTWVNRTTYVHPYTVRRFDGPRPGEGHRLEERSRQEREAARGGRKYKEEHHR
jgi:Protein of unknown function (DUF3300)